MAVEKKHKFPPGIKPTKRKPAWAKVRELACFAEVDEAVREGWPVSHIVSLIQKKHGEWEELSESAVTARISAFRDSLPAAEVVKHQVPGFLANKMAEIEQGVDVIGEFERLYRIQMDRLAIDYELEKKFGKLMPTTTGEVRAAREILSALADARAKLGVPSGIDTQRAEDALRLHASENFGDARVSKVLSNPAKRQRLTNLVKLLAKKADDDKVIIEADHVVAGGE